MSKIQGGVIAVSRHIGALLGASWAVARAHWPLIVGALACSGLLCGWAMQWDGLWLESISSARTLLKDDCARMLSRWGDYFPGSVGLAVALGILGWIFKKRPWREAALACLVAASLAGILTSAIKIGVGRPRPLAELPDGSMGPTLNWKLHGFPSGHTSTAFGTAASLAVTLPPLGVGALLLAAGVGWARIYDRWHRPSDVWAGATLGGLVGVVVGMGYRRGARSAKHKGSDVYRAH